MITKTILTIFSTVIGRIIGVGVANMPGQELHIELNSIISAMLTITQQGVNFLYFIFGDTVMIILPIAIALLILKYTVVPLIQIFRSFFINSNV